MMKKIFLVGVAIIAGVALFGNYSLANPPFWRTVKFGATATTSLVYMTPGNATTTYTLSSTDETAYDKATVMFQITATSTGVVNPTVAVAIEHSHNGIDWYNEAKSPVQATTTLMTSDPFYSHSFKVSSSTANKGATDSTTRFAYSFSIDTPTKYTRVKFSVPASGGNVGLWGDIIGLKQLR